jgi:hypothetical protein
MARLSSSSSLAKTGEGAYTGPVAAPTNHPFLTIKSVRRFRLAVGFLALAMGVIAFLILCVTNGTVSVTSDRAWIIALAVFGLFVIVHVGLDQLWDEITGPDTGANVGDAPSAATKKTKPTSSTISKGANDSTNQLLTAIITTSGVVLAIIQAFNANTLDVTAKVGTVSLAFDLVLGFVLFGLTTDSTPLDDPAWHFRAYIFNLVLWGLSFGLLCIAFSFVFHLHT